MNDLAERLEQTAATMPPNPHRLTAVLGRARRRRRRQGAVAGLAVVALLVGGSVGLRAATGSGGRPPAVPAGPRPAAITAPERAVLDAFTNIGGSPDRSLDAVQEGQPLAGYLRGYVAAAHRMLLQDWAPLTTYGRVADLSVRRRDADHATASFHLTVDLLNGSATTNRLSVPLLLTSGGWRVDRAGYCTVLDTGRLPGVTRCPR